MANAIYPEVVGATGGSAAMRPLLETFAKLDLVWVADVEAVLKAAGDGF
jgi:hypothetical protein